MNRKGNEMTTKKNETEVDESKIDAVMEICTLLSKVEDPQMIYDFFGCLFTPAERKDFANRWHLVKELNAGTTQREIAKKYGMSLCNITRGSRELKKDDSAFKKFLELLKESNN